MQPKNIVLLTAVLVASAGADITPEWTLDTAPPSFAGFYDAVSDATGATFILANVRTGTGPADYDFAVTRVNSDGTSGWTSQFAGPVGQDVAAAVALSWDQAYVYALGRSSVPGFGNSDFAIIKYDAQTGQQIWATLYDGGDLGIDSPYDIAGTPDGGVVATGGIDTANEQRDFGTVKLDANGSVVWDRGYTGQYIFLFENDDANLVKVTPEGDVVISGTAVSFSREKIETIKYDGATGATIWEAEYNSPADDWARGLALAPNGDVVILGLEPNGVDHQWVVARYDGQTGVQRWVKLVDPGFDETIHMVIVGADGTVYATGATDPDGDDSNANQNLITIALEADTGAIRWLLEFGDLGLGDAEYGAGLYEDGAGSLYVFGATSSDSLVPTPFDTDGLVLRVDMSNGAILDMGLIDTTLPGGSIVSENFYQAWPDAHGNVYAIGTFGSTAGTGEIVSQFAFGGGCTADFTGDGELNFFDVQEFLSLFAAQDAAADLTGEGVFDFFDVQEFLALLAAGC